MSFLQKVQSATSAASTSAGQLIVDATRDPQILDPDDPVEVIAQCETGERVYMFPRRVTDAYPKLLEKATRFLRLDSLYEVLLGHGITCVSNTVLQDEDDRNRILLTAQKIGYVWSEGELLYIAEKTGQNGLARKVKNHMSGLAKEFARIFQVGKVSRWKFGLDEEIRHEYPGATAAGFSVDRVLYHVANDNMPLLARLGVEFPGFVNRILRSYALRVGKFRD